MCNGATSKSGWNIGISSVTGEKRPSPRFYFAMKSDRTSYNSSVFDIHKYTPRSWTHITVTYDETAIRMYIGKTLVATSLEQRGEIFGSIARKCKEIRLGGGLDASYGYRGTVDELRIYNRPLSQSEISDRLSNIHQTKNHQSVVLYEHFGNTKGWRKASRIFAKLVKSDISLAQFTYLVKTPPCGKTICDDPVLMQSYLKHPQLRSQKQLHYKVINVQNDDGSDPQVSVKQIMDQNISLQNAFNIHNISWVLEPTSNIRDSKLRKKIILMGCDPWDVGDEECNPECKHSRTGNDGGDCEPIPVCNRTSLNNSRCDFECNKEYHLWDLGDCCKDHHNNHLTCFDPASKNR